MEKLTMVTPAKNTVCLWHDGDAEEEARFYAAMFPESAVGAVPRAVRRLRDSVREEERRGAGAGNDGGS